MEIVNHFCQRFEQDDSDAFAELFTDDAIYVDSLYGTYKGRKAIKDFHERCHKEAREYRFSPISHLYRNDEAAAFEWKFSFVSLMPTSMGKKITLKGAGFLTLRNGKIVSYREYADSIAIPLKGNIPDDKIMKFYHHKYQADSA